MSDPRPIGIFDSGVGGLTVVRAVLDLVPAEPVLYFGDTARAPYGPRDVGEIREFAREIAVYLLERDVKLLVVACNAIESNAIEDLSERANVQLIGVIEPGVRAALRVTRNGRVGVIGTEATIASGAYPRAMATEMAASFRIMDTPPPGKWATRGPIGSSISLRRRGMLLDGMPELLPLLPTPGHRCQSAICRTCRTHSAKPLWRLERAKPLG
jgi:hypothetical protein